MRKYINGIILLLLCLGTGFIGSVLTNESVKTWYPTLAKPLWNPPNWVFPVVWTILFILMAISAWLVGEKESYKSKPIFFFIVQLVLNSLWSLCFFYLQNPFLAFLEILVLIAFIVVTMISFLHVHKFAAILFIPYFLWVCFAAFLNYTIWQLN